MSEEGCELTRSTATRGGYSLKGALMREDCFFELAGVEREERKRRGTHNTRFCSLFYQVTRTSPRPRLAPPPTLTSQPFFKLPIVRLPWDAADSHNGHLLD